MVAASAGPDRHFEVAWSFLAGKSYSKMRNARVNLWRNIYIYIYSISLRVQGDRLEKDLQGFSKAREGQLLSRGGLEPLLPRHESHGFAPVWFGAHHAVSKVLRGMLRGS